MNKEMMGNGHTIDFPNVHILPEPFLQPTTLTLRRRCRTALFLPPSTDTLCLPQHLSVLLPARYAQLSHLGRILVSRLRRLWRGPSPIDRHDLGRLRRVAVDGAHRARQAPRRCSG